MFAIIAIAGVSASPLVIRASDSVTLAKKYVDAAVRVLSTQPEVAVAIGAEAAHKISSLDWLAWLIASSTEETSPQLLTRQLEAVAGALPQQIFPSAGDESRSASLTLIGAGTVISQNDGGAAIGDPANFASATTLPDYDPGPLGFYSARYLGKHLAFAEDTDLVYFDAGLSKNARWDPADTEVARRYFSLGGSDPTLYFEQDFLQYYGYIPTDDEVPAALPFYDLIDTRDSAASLYLSTGLYVSIDPDSMTVLADRRSLGVVRYVEGFDPVTLGDIYVGNAMVSWNGKPDRGAVTFSVFDAFDQGDLFVSPISSKDGRGKRIVFDAGALDSHDFTKEPLALKDELAAASFDGDLVNFLAACDTSQPAVRTSPERQCTVQSSMTPVASPVLLVVASPRVSTDKTGLTGTTPPPAESDTSEPGCNSGVCFGLIDIKNRTFARLPNTKLWAKPVAGDPSAIQFAVGGPATGQPGLHRIALWSEWGPSINVVSLSSGDTIDQRPDDGTYAPVLLPRWADDRITAAFFSDDGYSLLAEINNRVDRWTLRPRVGALSLAAIEALFCEERDRRFNGDMIAQYNKEVDLAPGTTPENNCPKISGGG